MGVPPPPPGRYECTGSSAELHTRRLSIAEFGLPVGPLKAVHDGLPVTFLDLSIGDDGLSPSCHLVHLTHGAMAGSFTPFCLHPHASPALGYPRPSPKPLHYRTRTAGSVTHVTCRLTVFAPRAAVADALLIFASSSATRSLSPPSQTRALLVELMEQLDSHRGLSHAPS